MSILKNIKKFLRYAWECERGDIRLKVWKKAVRKHNAKHAADKARKLREAATKLRESAERKATKLRKAAISTPIKQAGEGLDYLTLGLTNISGEKPWEPEPSKAIAHKDNPDYKKEEGIGGQNVYVNTTKGDYVIGEDGVVVYKSDDPTGFNVVTLKNEHLDKEQKQEALVSKTDADLDKLAESRFGYDPETQEFADPTEITGSAQAALDAFGLQREKQMAGLAAGQQGRFTGLMDRLKMGGAGTGAEERLSRAAERTSGIERQKTAGHWGDVSAKLRASDLAKQRDEQTKFASSWKLDFPLRQQALYQEQHQFDTANQLRLALAQQQQESLRQARRTQGQGNLYGMIGLGAGAYLSGGSPWGAALGQMFGSSLGQYFSSQDQPSVRPIDYGQISGY